MTKDPRTYLEDIRESIEKILDYTAGASRDDFMDNTEMQDACIRRFEIIGEAVKHIPAELKERYGGQPWKQIAGMRDVFIHEYFAVNIERVWLVIQDSLETLKETVEKMIDDLAKKS